jgi:hypothetical protein
VYGIQSNSRIISHNFLETFEGSWSGWKSIPVASDEGVASLPDVFVKPVVGTGSVVFFLTGFESGARTLKETSSAAYRGDFSSTLVNHGGFQTLSAPEVVADGEGRLVLFARGTDFQLYFRRQTGSNGWGPWSSLGGEVAAMGTN